MLSLDCGLKHFLKSALERSILILCAFFLPLNPVSGGALLPRFVANQKQGINVVTGVFPAVLMDHPAAPGKTHGCQSIVLGDNQISGICSADQRIIHTVRAFIKNQSHRTVPMKFVGGIAKQNTGDIQRFAQSDGNIRNRTAVGIDEYFNGDHLIIMLTALYHTKIELQSIFRRNQWNIIVFFKT